MLMIKHTASTTITEYITVHKRGYGIGQEERPQFKAIIGNLAEGMKLRLVEQGSNYEAQLFNCIDDTQLPFMRTYLYALQYQPRGNKT